MGYPLPNLANSSVSSLFPAAVYSSSVLTVVSASTYHISQQEAESPSTAHHRYLQDSGLNAIHYTRARYQTHHAQNFNLSFRQEQKITTGGDPKGKRQREQAYVAVDPTALTYDVRARPIRGTWLPRGPGQHVDFLLGCLCTDIYGVMGINPKTIHNRRYIAELIY